MPELAKASKEGRVRNRITVTWKEGRLRLLFLLIFLFYPLPPTKNQLLEAFGAGTAVVVCPIRAILYEGEEISIIHNGDSVGALTRRMWDALTDIQVRTYVTHLLAGSRASG